MADETQTQAEYYNRAPDAPKARTPRKTGPRKPKPKGKDRKTAILLVVSIILAIGNMLLMRELAITVKSAEMEWTRKN